MNSVTKKTNVFLLCLLALQFFYSVFVIFFRTNISVFDLGGHVGAAEQMARGYFHSYADFNFLGAPLNVLYPLLSDVLINIFTFLSFGNYLIGTKLFLSAITLLLLISFFLLSQLLKNKNHRIIFIALVLFYLDTSSFYLQFFQGFSLRNLVLLGFCAQTLGTSFLFLFIRSLYIKSPYYVSSLFIGLCFISHILAGLLALCLLFFYCLFQYRNKYYFYTGLLGCGLGSIYIIPFAFHTPYFLSTNISNHLWSVSLILLCASLLNIFIWLKLKPAFIPILSIVASGLCFVNLVDFLSMQELNVKIFPNFQYFRFMIYAFFFYVFEFLFLLEDPNVQVKIPWQKSAPLFMIVMGSIIFIGQMKFNIYNYLFSKENHLNPIEIKNFAPSEDLKQNWKNQYGRLAFTENKNPLDRNISELLRVTVFPDLYTTNGVYWEISRSNYLFSSYLSLLFKNPNNVIDRYVKKINNCGEYKCIFDQFITDFNVNSLAFTEQELTQSCFNDMLSIQGTQNYNLHKGGFFTTQEQGTSTERTYQFLSITPRLFGPKSLSNSAAEILQTKAYRTYYIHDKIFYKEYFDNLTSACFSSGQQPQINYINANDTEKYEKLMSGLSSDNFENHSVSFRKIKKNIYEIFVDSPTPLPFKIKFNDMPGLKLFDEKKQEIELIHGIGSMIAVGHGRMTLVYDRPWYFYLSYVLSSISLGVVLYFFKETT